MSPKVSGFSKMGRKWPFLFKWRTVQKERLGVHFWRGQASDVYETSKQISNKQMNILVQSLEEMWTGNTNWRVAGTYLSLNMSKALRMRYSTQCYRRFLLSLPLLILMLIIISSSLEVVKIYPHIKSMSDLHSKYDYHT